MNMLSKLFLFVFFLFQCNTMPQPNKSAMQNLIEFSSTIINVEIVEVGSEIYDEAGVIEQAALAKIIYIYKGDLSSSSYAAVFFHKFNYLKNKDGSQIEEVLKVEIGLNYLLFLRPCNSKYKFNLINDKLPGFDLSDRWLGVIQFNEYLHNYVITELEKKK